MITKKLENQIKELEEKYGDDKIVTRALKINSLINNENKIIKKLRKKR